MEVIWMPFQFTFMQIAFLIAVLVAVPTALLSCFLVLKGWSLMGDAISHAVLPGLVLAFMAGLPLALGAFAAGFACAAGTGYLADNSRVKPDTVMGVVFAGMFGLGLVLIAQVPAELHLDHILFGDMLGVLPADLWFSACVAGIVVLAVTVFWKDLLLHAFDPAQARVVGLRTGLLHYGLLALIAASVVGALKSVGIILTVAMLIAPGAIAVLMTRRFGTMLIAAVTTSVAASIGGVYASFFLGSSPGSTIVVMMTAMFIVVFAATLLRQRSQG